MTVALLLTAATATPGESPAWPPFLSPPDQFAPDLRASIEHVWADPTLSRTVQGRPAAVPFDIYMAFVDAPDVTAAAARLIQLATYEVRAGTPPTTTMARTASTVSSRARTPAA